MSDPKQKDLVIEMQDGALVMYEDEVDENDTETREWKSF